MILILLGAPAAVLAENCAIQTIHIRHKYPLACPITPNDCWLQCIPQGCTDEVLPCRYALTYDYVFDCNGNFWNINNVFPHTPHPSCISHQEPDNLAIGPVTYWNCNQCAGSLEDMENDCDCKGNEPVVCPGEPINIIRGNMVHEIPLFNAKLPGPEFKLTLRYNSRNTNIGSVGYGWKHNYEFTFYIPSGQATPHPVSCQGLNSYPVMGRFSMNGGGNTYFVFLPREFLENCAQISRPISSSADIFLPVNSRGLRMSDTDDGSGNRTFTISAEDRTAYVVAENRLQTITDANGITLTFTYDPSGRLAQVDHSLGRTIRFSYTGDRLAEVVDPAGNSYHFTYSGDNLHAIEYPECTIQTFYYTDPYDAHNLTSITNNDGDTIVSWTYNASDLAVSSSRYNGAEALTVSYPSNFRNITAGDITVTNSRSQATVYHFVTRGDGTRAITSITGSGCGSCGLGGEAAYTYDSSGRVTQVVRKVSDTQNATTKYEGYYIDTQNRGDFARLKEAVGTAEERIANYTYHPNLKTHLTETRQSVLGGTGTSKDTIYDYDNDGNSNPNENPTARLHRLIEKGYTRDAATGAIVQKNFITTYTYDAIGRIMSVDGPRTDVNDLTAYTYYANDSSQGDNRGMLRQVTNPAGHIVAYGDYDAFGQVGYTTDANGLTTRYTYDARGRVSTVTLQGAGPSGEDLVTANFYDSDGRLDYIRLPGGGVVDYDYDPAGRLLSMTRRSGPDDMSAAIDSIVYTYDTEGNKTGESLHEGEVTGTTRNTTTFDYDSFNRLWRLIHSDSTYQEYRYDQVGNRISVKDEKSQETTYLFDVLHRLKSVNAPGGVATNYQYDKHDNPIRVTDPKGVETRYEYDDFGRVLKVDSPDAGITEYRYDDGGNLLKKIDANGVTSLYTYDALGRTLSVNPDDPQHAISYSYDSCSALYGLGRLTGITDPSGSLSYRYDIRGTLTREEKQIAGTAFVTEYYYDKDGNLTASVYPSGRRVNYRLNAAGQVIGVEGTNNAATETYVRQGVSYYPFGPVASYQTGDGLTTTLSYDQDYRLTALQVPGVLSRQYGYDHTGNITDITDLLDAGRTQGFGYDELNRLTNASGIFGSIAFTYDNNGNRLTKADAGGFAMYAYAHNRLSGITGSETKTFSYDGAGNITQENLRTYAYNQHSRLKEVIEDGTPLADEYVYDALGRRVKKVANGVTRMYLYDQRGMLIEECGADGTWETDYLYLNGRPLAHITNAGGGNLPFELTVTDGSRNPLPSVPVYLFTATGLYSGTSSSTNDQGKASFNVEDGSYKFRLDYLGYQFWTESVTYPTTISLSFPIAHQDVATTVQEIYLGADTPLNGVNVYLFTPGGSYLGKVQQTGGDGQTVFSLPAKEYKFRADYLGRQYWSPTINQQSAIITINNGLTHLTVAQAENPLADVPVYVFAEGGSYLGINGTTSPEGSVDFELPAGAYKFRADYQGSRYWSSVIEVVADQTADTSIDVGGGLFTLALTRGGTDYLAGVNVYAFTESGSYLGLASATDANGQASFRLANGSYKFRADYLGYQFWTEVYAVPSGLSGTLLIGHADVAVTVQKSYLGMATPLNGVNVYLFTSGGSYLGKVQQTEGAGQTVFSLPAKEYKFRADYLGRQYWSPTVNQHPATITINYGLAHVTVEQNETPVGNVPVYVFAEGGSYLGINGTTSPEGSVDFELPAGAYKFRADFQASQYWSSQIMIVADQTTNALISAGGGLFILTVTRDAGEGLAGVRVYAFTHAGAYLGLYGLTNENGEVSFPLADGGYKFRADYLGYQFWTEAYAVPSALSGTLLIGHADVTVSVQRNYLGEDNPLPGVKVYLFTSGGSYQGTMQQTGGDGQTVFSLPAKEYKFRADYLGRQYWSATVNQQPTTITINYGLATLNVNDAGTPLANVNAYVFSATGSYLGVTAKTNLPGDVTFELPSGEYKFRADYGGSRYWSTVQSLTADATTAVSIDIRTAAHSFMERKLRGRKPLMLASAGSLQGILTSAIIQAIPGEEVYYYHNDHLGTPQAMTDATGTVVWKADYLPFGEATVDEDPDGDGIPVTNNLRFPGQYFDVETGLHYNWHRDYYPGLGRYIESDPIGLNEGTRHLYLYGENSPLGKFDPQGLKTYRCKSPLHALDRFGRNGTHSGPDIWWNPLYHEYLCVGSPYSNTCCGQDRESGEGAWAPGRRSYDSYSWLYCDEVEPDNKCIEGCIKFECGRPRPPYGFLGPGTNCQEWAKDTLEKCRENCKCWKGK